MHRILTITLLALPLVACGYETRASDPIDAEDPAVLQAPGVGVDDPSGAGDASGAPEAPAVCGPEGQYEVAPAGSPACSLDAVCDADADCAHLSGTYCLSQVCAFGGCLRGACLLTKVQGQACSRDGECVSQRCDCASGECVCAPEEGEGTFHFP